MRFALAALALLSLIPACKKDSPLKDVTDAKFHVGQRWSYWARPGEEQSTFTIEKIESHPTLGVVIHIGLDNLKLTRDKKTVGIVVHLPFARAAIDSSAAKVVDESSPIPPFNKEYDAWRKLVDDGGGTVIQSTIADQLNAMEDK